MSKPTRVALRLSLAMAAGFLSLMLCGCGSTPDEQEKKTLDKAKTSAEETNKDEIRRSSQNTVRP